MITPAQFAQIIEQEGGVYSALDVFSDEIGDNNLEGARQALLRAKADFDSLADSLETALYQKGYTIDFT